MAAVGYIYTQALKSAFNKQVDLDTDAWRLMLMGSAYAANTAAKITALDTHQYKSDLTSEVSGTGYTAGGAAVGSIAFVNDTTLHQFGFTAGNVSWGPGASFTAPRFGAIYDSTPATDATRPLLMLLDFGTDQTIGGTFTLNLSAATKVMRITMARPS